MLCLCKYSDSHFLLSGGNYATIKEMLSHLVFNACYGGKGHTRAVYTTGTWGSPVILPIRDEATYRVSRSIGIYPDNQSQYQQQVSVWFHHDDPPI